MYFIGEQSYCIQCHKLLTMYDNSKVFIENINIKLTYFCLSCKYSLPYIHKVKCTICHAHQACYNSCTINQELRQNFSSVAYNDEVKELLRTFKFEGNVAAGQALSPLFLLPIARYLKETKQFSLLKKVIRRGLFSYGEGTSSYNIVTSVPISRQRLIERGFNQATFFAKHVANRLNAPFVNFLYREDGFEHISHLNKHERERVVQHLYKIKQDTIDRLNSKLSDREIKPINIIIVDDIYTTGNTLKACAKEIKRSTRFPCQIYGITLARA